jgi:hypothetical protein
MLEKDTKFDVVVIGAGPAGIIAAATAAESGVKVLLIEKNSKLAKKFLLTGNGRCNLSNAEFRLKELVKNYNNGEFLFHAFSVFGSEQIVNFFKKLGVKIKIESNKRAFPESDDAGEILKVLEKKLEKNKLKVLFNSEVVDVIFKARKINKLILKDGEVVAKKYIFCTGGKSYPLTGSDGVGYKLSEKLGHTIIKPKPALAPIMLKEEWVKDVQGISLKDIRINVFQNNKKQFSEPSFAKAPEGQGGGEIIFTHFGISGPVVLNISGRVGDLLEKSAYAGSGEVKIYIDLFPELNQEEVLRSFEEILKKYPNQINKNIISELMPERFAEVFLNILKIEKEKIANNMSKAEKAMITKTFKNIELTPEDILGFDLAYITRGGIDLKEIDHKTMKSKIIDNLFFAGEIINVDAKTGGFNLQECWSTGHLAGENAVKD